MTETIETIETYLAAKASGKITCTTRGWCVGSILGTVPDKRVARVWMPVRDDCRVIQRHPVLDGAHYDLTDLGAAQFEVDCLNAGVLQWYRTVRV